MRKWKQAAEFGSMRFPKYQTVSVKSTIHLLKSTFKFSAASRFKNLPSLYQPNFNYVF